MNRRAFFRGLVGAAMLGATRSLFPARARAIEVETPPLVERQITAIEFLEQDTRAMEFINEYRRAFQDLIVYGYSEFRLPAARSRFLEECGARVSARVSLAEKAEGL